MENPSRRRFFSQLVKPSRQAESKHTTIHQLPWLKSDNGFTDICTRCEKCIQSCESNIIVKGVGGFPTVEFSVGECTFCYQCAENCPESLFDEKTTLPWQIKADISSACLAKNNIECRSCAEQCDQNSIQFKLQIGKVAQPQVDITSCNGCGACVAGCPVSAISL
ncbi:ferredoxin-type protein NapF [Vibrio sp. SS-MA-C1-2]|uniref:ferredoxin-type protein NapF n=1 Tax=Vibrio sp. SS-MA-C1-2 TaxID=2908646 RepID=UPI001F3A37CE|nr:ferredoxin-type protein NapF [Vibrio sp. SS-MA-C1-2]UJF17182.1 ferredoxin-type protein NapF [Vibrio sp. SS-MA-C1-2]